nr:PfkB family carbohydrate kinase [Pseudophaeobacter sp. EL27]
MCGPLPINAGIDPSVKYSPALKVVDTTAAGDSFGGAFLASFLTGGSLSNAMQAGHTRASQVVGHRGAIAEAF